jgi:predicted metalloprotease
MKSNSGRACTCVVTEYHYHDQDDFVIHVEYFTMSELRKQFQELLAAYRQHEMGADSMTAAEREDLAKRAELALDTFQASFRPELEQNPRILLDSSLEDALHTLVVWADKVIPRQLQSDSQSRSRETFGDLQECSERLKMLTSETEGASEACRWPFIRKIRFVISGFI